VDGTDARRSGRIPALAFSSAVILTIALCTTASATAWAVFHGILLERSLADRLRKAVEGEIIAEDDDGRNDTTSAGQPAEELGDELYRRVAAE
jgi:hypothetical protein